MAPNMFRFLICSSFLYVGFSFAGWVILGPYHFKFETLMSTSECLFSLINGDDMFATLSSIPMESLSVWVYSRVYLYTFICLFIYVVLSLFISIIMDTYEISASISEGPAFHYLDAPVIRICGVDAPMPYAATLETAATPQPHNIVAAVKRMLGK